MVHKRWIALAVLGALLGQAACTRQVPRQSIEPRYYRVHWSALTAPTLRLGALSIQGIVLTPAQWPLEVSLKRLMEGDFVGVIADLDLTFRSSRLPFGVLSDLYDEGFIPAYVRVRNTGTAPEWFDPGLLVVRVDGGRTLPHVSAASLPRETTVLDLKRTGMLAVVVALTALIVAAGRAPLPDPFQDSDASQSRGARPIRNPPPAAYRSAPAPSPVVLGDAGVLGREPIAPGRAREGYVLFARIGTVIDWDTARLDWLHVSR